MLPSKCLEATVDMISHYINKTEVNCTKGKNESEFDLRFLRI